MLIQASRFWWRALRKYIYCNGQRGQGEGDTIEPHGRDRLEPRDKGLIQDYGGGRHIYLYFFQGESFEIVGI